MAVSSVVPFFWVLNHPTNRQQKCGLMHLGATRRGTEARNMMVGEGLTFQQFNCVNNQFPIDRCFPFKADGFSGGSPNAMLDFPKDACHGS